jgi:hypothetical protein
MQRDVHTPQSRLTKHTSTSLSQHTHIGFSSTDRHEAYASEAHDGGTEPVSNTRAPRSVPTRMRIITEDARNNDSDTDKSTQIKHHQHTRGVADSDPDTLLSREDSTGRGSTHQASVTALINTSSTTNTQTQTQTLSDVSPALKKALLAREEYMLKQSLIPKDPAVKQAMWFSKVLKHEPEMPKGRVDAWTTS